MRLFWQRWPRLSLLTLCALCFFVGLQAGERRSGATPHEVAELRQTVSLYAREWHQDRAQVLLAQRDRQVTQAAMDQLQKQNKDLLDGMAVIEQQLRLYKQIADPHAHAGRLSLEKFSLYATPERQRYAYRLLLTRAHREGGSETGVIDVKVSGLQGGRSQQIQLHVGDDHYNLQYFQSFSGEWVLPAGFVPQLLTFRLGGSGAQRQHVVQQFKWALSPS